jgi:hypothetical protein
MEAEKVYEGGTILWETRGLILGALGFAERSGVLEWDCISTGTGVARGFGHRGQDIHMISWS